MIRTWRNLRHALSWHRAIARLIDVGLTPIIAAASLTVNASLSVPTSLLLISKIFVVCAAKRGWKRAVGHDCSRRECAPCDASNLLGSIRN